MKYKTCGNSYCSINYILLIFSAPVTIHLSPRSRNKILLAFDNKPFNDDSVWFQSNNFHLWHWLNTLRFYILSLNSQIWTLQAISDASGTAAHPIKPARPDPRLYEDMMVSATRPDSSSSESDSEEDDGAPTGIRAAPWRMPKNAFKRKNEWN